MLCRRVHSGYLFAKTVSLFHFGVGHKLNLKTSLCFLIFLVFWICVYNSLWCLSFSFLKKKSVSWSGLVAEAVSRGCFDVLVCSFRINQKFLKINHSFFSTPCQTFALNALCLLRHNGSFCLISSLKTMTLCWEIFITDIGRLPGVRSVPRSTSRREE